MDHSDKEGHFVTLDANDVPTLVTSATAIPNGVITQGRVAGSFDDVMPCDGAVELGVVDAHAHFLGQLQLRALDDHALQHLTAQVGRVRHLRGWNDADHVIEAGDVAPAARHHDLAEPLREFLDRSGIDHAADTAPDDRAHAHGTGLAGRVECRALELGGWETFWILFYGFATYGNAGFLREQVCKYMCPYARFQSAMFDKDTLIVTYDKQRGEPRGARSKKADLSKLGLGACVDCSLCVQVCPTGIDIRNGLQYECIACGACIDACDEVMDKIGSPRGLIRYSSQTGLEQGWGRDRVLQRALRPRVLVYGALLLAISAAFVIGLLQRSPFRVDVMRDRGVLARMVEQGAVADVALHELDLVLHVRQVLEPPGREVVQHPHPVAAWCATEL